MADYRPNMLLKGISVLLLYVLLGHPSAYVAVWQQRNWYVIVLLPVALLMLVPWCIRALVWRVRISPSTIEMRSPRGLFSRRLADLTQVERVPGRILIAFKDGSQRAIPAIVGDLSRIETDIKLGLDHKA